MPAMEQTITVPEITDDMDVPNTVARAFYESAPEKNWDTLEESKQKKKESRVKKLLNTQAVKQMTIERLHDRNAYDDLKLWFDTIKNLN